MATPVNFTIPLQKLSPSDKTRLQLRSRDSGGVRRQKAIERTLLEKRNSYDTTANSVTRYLNRGKTHIIHTILLDGPPGTSSPQTPPLKSRPATPLKAVLAKKTAHEPYAPPSSEDAISVMSSLSSMEEAEATGDYQHNKNDRLVLDYDGNKSRYSFPRRLPIRQRSDANAEAKLAFRGLRVQASEQNAFLKRKRSRRLVHFSADSKAGKPLVFVNDPPCSDSLKISYDDLSYVNYFQEAPMVPKQKAPLRTVLPAAPSAKTFLTAIGPSYTTSSSISKEMRPLPHNYPCQPRRVPCTVKQANAALEAVAEANRHMSRCSRSVTSDGRWSTFTTELTIIPSHQPQGGMIIRFPSKSGAGTEAPMGAIKLNASPNLTNLCSPFAVAHPLRSPVRPKLMQPPLQDNFHAHFMRTEHEFGSYMRQEREVPREPVLRISEGYLESTRKGTADTAAWQGDLRGL